jgi:hypothetical protein
MSKESRQRASKAREKEVSRGHSIERARSLEKSLSITVALLALAVYCLTCSRSLIGGDSGELTVVAMTGGVAHPPGYPLFTMIARLFGLIPVSTYAFRIAFLSGMCGSVAAGFLTASVTRWAANAWAGVFSGVLFAFAPLIWTNSTVAEVFALNNLFLAVLLYLSVRFIEEPSEKKLLLAALVFGLGLSNHHTLLLCGAPLLLFLFARLGWRWAMLPKVLLCVGAGLLPYLYLPLASSKISLLSWGDQTTWAGVWSHLTRAEYGSLQLAAGVSAQQVDWIGNLGHFASQLPRQTLGVLWLLPLAVFFGRSERGSGGGHGKLFYFWCGNIALYLLIFCSLSNMKLSDPVADFIVSRFWQAPILLLFALAGLGWSQLVIIAEGKLWRPVLVAVTVVAGLLQLGLNFQSQDLSKRDHFDRVFEKALEMLPKDAILLTTGDHLVGSIQYQQLFRGIRPDVAVLDQYMLFYPWAKRLVRKNHPRVILPGNGRYRSGDYHMKDFLAANLPVAPVFSFGGVVSWDSDWMEQYESHVHGITLQFIPKNSLFGVEQWRSMNEAFFRSLDLGQLAHAKRGTWDYLLLRQFWEAKRNFAVELMRISTRDTKYEAWLSQGLVLLDEILAAQPEPDPLVFKYRGLAYAVLATRQPEAKAKMVENYRRYLELRQEPDSELPAIEAAVRGAR